MVDGAVTGGEPRCPADGDRKIAFAYDYLGRRVEKKVWTWDPNGAGGTGAWVLTSHRRFIWYNWLLLLELDALDHDGDGQPDNAVIRKYTWGLDLAGLHGQVNSLEAAGGTLDTRPAARRLGVLRDRGHAPTGVRQGQAGGLLAIDDPNDRADPHGSFACFYDANGNLAQLVDLADGSLAARYEYDPYGNLTGPDTDGDGVFDPATDDAGPYAAENPVRFSTKYFDAETGFGYWGYRYYSPRLGRWLSRDRLEEEGGPLLYGFVYNAPPVTVDALGDKCPDCCPPAPGFPNVYNKRLLGFGVARAYSAVGPRTVKTAQAAYDDAKMIAAIWGALYDVKAGVGDFTFSTVSRCFGRLAARDAGSQRAKLAAAIKKSVAGIVTAMTRLGAYDIYLEYAYDSCDPCRFGLWGRRKGGFEMRQHTAEFLCGTYGVNSLSGRPVTPADLADCVRRALR